MNKSFEQWTNENNRLKVERDAAKADNNSLIGRLSRLNVENADLRNNLKINVALMVLLFAALVAVVFS